MPKKSNIKDKNLAIVMGVIKDIVKSGCVEGDPESEKIFPILMYEESEYLETGDLNKMTTYRGMIEYLKDAFTEAYDKFEEARPGWRKRKDEANAN